MRRLLAALALAVVLPLPLLAAEVTVRPGETLSDIADRSGVSLSRLMKANGITDADRVEAGRRLMIPGGSGSGSQAKATGGRVTVKPGETLSQIADRQGMTVSRLLQLNGLSDPDHVEVGQILKVTSSVKAASSTKGGASPFSYKPGASEHVVRPGESLSAIAKGYGVPMSRLVTLNRIENANKVEAGDRLRVVGNPAPSATTPAAKPATVAKATSRAPAAATPVASAGSASAAKANWRAYGPLQVDWSNWQSMGGSLVAPTINASGQSFYLAINCSARKLNATSTNGQWKTWDDPTAAFEKKLVTDLCKSRRG